MARIADKILDFCVKMTHIALEKVPKSALKEWSKTLQLFSIPITKSDLQLPKNGKNNHQSFQLVFKNVAKNCVLENWSQAVQLFHVQTTKADLHLPKNGKNYQQSLRLVCKNGANCAKKSALRDLAVRLFHVPTTKAATNRANIWKALLLESFLLSNFFCRRSQPQDAQLQPNGGIRSSAADGIHSYTTIL